MINFDDYTSDNKTEHNLMWPYIPDHLYRIITIGGSGSGKTNALLNLIDNEPNIGKIYSYAKDPYKAKYQLSISKSESTGLSILRILKLLFNIQMRSKMFIKILKNTT